jgi:hypothetical protein
MRTWLFLACALVWVACPLPLLAKDSSTFTVDIPHGDKITITLPPKWDHSVAPVPTNQRTLMTADEKMKVSLQITFMPDIFPKDAKPEDVDRLVKIGDEHYVAGSVEKKLKLVPMKSKFGFGSYATFTDASLANLKQIPPKKYLHVASGIFLVGRNAAVFTVLSNDTDSEEYKQALKVVSEGMSANEK